MDVRWLIVVAGALLVGSMTGCDRLPFGRSSSTDDEFAEFDDFDATDEKSVELGDSSTAEGPGSAPAYEAAALPTSAQELSPQLPVGARFPLIKTVQQRLIQQLPTGPVVGTTWLELRMSLLVENQRPDARLVSVRYHRVMYRQDLGGEAVQYDSDAPPGPVHPAAIAYTGLKDNTFSFWLGSDHRIVELVGFEEFLRRCVAPIPADQRNAAWLQLSALRSEDGLANFVDDSLGLLPKPNDPRLAGKPLDVGSTWELGTSSLIRTPGSGTRCVMKSLTADTAEISLMGMIEPSSYVDDIRKLKLFVKGGQCSGLCRVDRRTGIPTQSRVDRLIDMVAQLPDGTEIPQRKEVTTTVTAYLDQQPSSTPATASMGHATAPGATPYASPAAGTMPATGNAFAPALFTTETPPAR